MFSKTMVDYDYAAPETKEEVFDLLQQYGKGAVLMLGGTDLVPKMKARVINPQMVINLMNIKDLKNLTWSQNGGLHIGSGVTLDEIEKFPVVKEKYQALYEGVHAIASTQIRNIGTIVGNICNAVPSADSAPGLLVLDATVVLESKEGVREVPIAEFFTGVCKTVVQPGELVTELVIPTPKENQRSVYYPHTIRRALDLAIVGVAASAVMEDGVCSDIRIALGAVAITPKRAVKAEEFLRGKELTPKRIEEAALIASEQECAPISDMRASKEFRKEIVRVLTKNAVTYCMG